MLANAGQFPNIENRENFTGRWTWTIILVWTILDVIIISSEKVQDVQDTASNQEIVNEQKMTKRMEKNRLDKIKNGFLNIGISKINLGETTQNYWGNSG